MIPISSTLLPKLTGVGILALMLFSGGCWTQRRLDAGAIAKKDAALSSASTALLGAKSAIEEINQEAEKRIAAAKKQEADSRAAEKIAQEANAASAKRADKFAGRLAKAGKSKPDCAALLSMDLEAVCGVKSR